MTRVVVCNGHGAEGPRLSEHLQREGFEVEYCKDGEALIETILARPADAVVYNLRRDIHADLAVLHLLRRVRPLTPLILLCADTSLRTRRTMQELRPTFFAVSPADGAEVTEALRSAVHRKKVASR